MIFSPVSLTKVEHPTSDKTRAAIYVASIALTTQSQSFVCLLPCLSLAVDHDTERSDQEDGYKEPHDAVGDDRTGRVADVDWWWILGVLLEDAI